MDIIILGKLALILLLVAGNAFFVGSEIAITSARRSRIKQLADLGNPSAQAVRLLHEEPERFYSVTQIGITLVSLGLGAIGMETVAQLMDPAFEWVIGTFLGGDLLWLKAADTASYVLAFVIISFLHVVGGELAPKVLAFHRAEALSMKVGWLINLFYRMLKPLIWVMNESSKLLLWACGAEDVGAGRHGHFSMSREEIQMILLASEAEGQLNPEDTRMIRGVFDLNEHTVREAMTPRTDILALPKEAKMVDAVAIFTREPHARFPVYDGDVDHVIGILSLKEMVTAMAEAEDGTVLWQRPVSDFMHPPYIVPNSKPLSDLLKDFKAARQHMAVVIDEYGGTEGVITLEDILEEIVGDYADEFTPQARRAKRLENGHYLIDASVRVSDADPLVNYVFPTDEDYITLAGLFYKRFGKIPKVGDKVMLEGAILQVAEMDNHRITRLMFQDLRGVAEGAEEVGTVAIAEVLPHKQEQEE